MATVYQNVQLTATTNASGYLTYSFPNNIDKCMATVNNPQSGGTGNSVVSCACEVTGAKQVTLRVWMTDVNWTVQPAVSKQVTVTILGMNG